MNLKQTAKKLKIDIPAVSIAFKKKETPVIAKIFAALAIGYALSPIDLIPDFSFCSHLDFDNLVDCKGSFFKLINPRVLRIRKKSKQMPLI